MPFSRRQLTTLLLLSVLTLASVAPSLVRHGTNIVTETYAQASQRIYANQSPYQPPSGVGDWYKYSPLFAILYTPIAALGEPWHPLLWSYLNILVFWAGVLAWFPVRASLPLFLGYLFCSMELDGSLRYQQVNALILGMTLMALSLYYRQKLFLSGVLLALATNFKILPGIFLLPLLLKGKLPFYRGVAIGFLASFVLPWLVVDPELGIRFHYEWLSFLFRDITAPGLLDAHTVAKNFGLLSASAMVRPCIVLISIALLLWQGYRTMTEMDWHLLIALGLTTVLLLNPRTESPTFVFAGATYLYLGSFVSNMKTTGFEKTLLALVLLASVFLISIAYNDIWPKSLHPSHFYWKTVGVFLLWALSAWQMLRFEFYPSTRAWSASHGKT